MVTTSLATLSTLGFVKDAITKFEFLISHFFLSDYNQTYLYYGNVTSLPRIIEENGNNIDGTIYDIKEKLTKYLNRYYDSSQIEVYLSDPASLSGSVSITISAIVIDNGTRKSFTRMLQAYDGKVQAITKLNNYG